MSDLLDPPLRRDRALDGDLAGALARSAAALARLDQALGQHPLRPAFLFRARLEAVRRQAAVDGRAIDPWHLAAAIEGLPLRMPDTRMIDNGAVLDAARHALALHGWLAAPDFDQEGEIKCAERALDAAGADVTSLLAAPRAAHAWLESGGACAPLRAALVRFWQHAGLLRAPVPLTGPAALGAEVPWGRDRWTPHFLHALAAEAEDGLDLLLATERAWLTARAAVPARRSTSRAPAALDLLAATPLISATTLARSLGMSVKSALVLLEAFVREGVAVEATHRPARRLFALTGVGEEVRAVVRPPRRPEPGRRPGRPRHDRPETAAPDAPAPLPALHPIARLPPPIDYARLDTAMAHADQAICDARRRLAATMEKGRGSDRGNTRRGKPSY